MPKRPDSLENVLFTLGMLQRIPRNRKVSALELQAQLANAGIVRDRRTIQRQLEMLCRNFDIECDDRNKPYGYRWKEQAKGLSVPMLTAQESLLLLLAEQHLRNLLPAGLMKSFDGFFAQARSNLGPYTNARREREWLSKVRVVSTTQPLLPPRIKPGVFEAVSNALYGNRWLKVEYQNAVGKKSNGEVMPLGLAQQGPRLYLVCRYRGFDDERSLALHRIVSAKTSTLTFERPRDFDLQRFDDEGRFGFGDGRRIRLSFCIDKEAGLHLLESPLSVDQQVKELGGEFRISATVVETAQLEWWLRGFGDQIRSIRRSSVRNSRIDKRENVAA